MDSRCHIVRYTARTAHLGMLIFITKAIPPIHFLIKQMFCSVLFCSVYARFFPTYPPRLVYGLNIIPIHRSLPSTPLLGFSFSHWCGVYGYFTFPCHHPAPFMTNSRLACDGSEVLYHPRNSTTTCTPLHRITSMTGLSHFVLSTTFALYSAIPARPLPSPS